MAQLVLGVGVPHAPTFPKQVLEEGPDSPTGALFRRVADELEAARPDVLVVFDSDHFVNFFFDNMPAFCIGIVDEAWGPDETRLEMPKYTVQVHEAFARALLDFALAREFDMASKEEMVLDHSVLVPLHFLTPRMHVPIVPVYVRGLAAPLPRASRCVALGRMVREFVLEHWPGRERVGVLASGSFSLEVGGPRMGWTDEEWMRTVVSSLSEGDTDGLVQCATTERMLAAGNVSGELLNWCALLGAVGDTKAHFIEPQQGHAFAVWRL
jgi:aromatic ring-opening dioxygenase catalytic subunit (LigB family)